MTNETPGGELSEEQRLAAYRKELRETSRHGGRAMRPTMPPRSVLVVAAVIVVLGLGGTVLEHYFGGAASTSTTTTSARPATTTTSGSQLTASTRAFIGLKEIASAKAPALVLRDQSGRTWRLSDFRGHLVIVTFYAKDCRDICPVLGAELRDTLDQLETQGIQPVVAIVNTDPHDVGLVADPAALREPGLDTIANVFFLTGSLEQLNATWVDYGVTVRVGSSPSEVTHNNVLYFVDARGRLRALAVPFGHESRAAVYSLSAANEDRFAQGIATEAGSLAR
jgi:cytochrome oxidase Cu insertion factor (SCO1/SenC/PrrC family)